MIGAIPQPIAHGLKNAETTLDMKIDEHELTSLVKSFEDLTTVTEQAIEAMPKVIECFNCDEYAFDGTFTAYMTDTDGEQPFCLECVAAIAKRSTPRDVYPAPSFTWKPNESWDRFSGLGTAFDYSVPSLTGYSLAANATA